MGNQYDKISKSTMSLAQLSQQVYVAQPMIDPKQVIDFMDGLILGLTKKEDLKEITQCLTHASDLAYQITDAVEDFEKGIIEAIPNDFQDCKSMQGDLQRIEKWGKIFENPTELAKVLAENVFAHLTAITSDIEKIPTDFSSQQYKNAGEDIADIMVQAIGPVPEITA